MSFAMLKTSKDPNTQESFSMTTYIIPPTVLYIKQHSITKKKYFGKTTAKDPYKYKGSGPYWQKHIKKHGKEHVITTQVFGPFTNSIAISEFALAFSSYNNIVKSKDWANQIPENGLDGGFDLINKNGLNFPGYASMEEKNRAITPMNKPGAEEIRKLARIGFNRMIEDPIRKQNWIQATNLGKSLSDRMNSDTSHMQTIERKNKRKNTFAKIGHQQGSKNSQFGTCWIRHDLHGNKKIQKDLLSQYIQQGWVKGRKM
jgi:hypothetical protein